LDQKRPDTITQLGLDGDAISYVGPLGAARTIKLDLADDELVVNTELRSLLRRWTDIPEIECWAYTKLEVAAEKLRCVLQRRQCRDFLDLDLLLGEADPAATADLFREKAKHRGLDPATFAEKFEKRVHDYKNHWDEELEQYLGKVPHFEEIERSVRRALRKAELL